LICKDVSKGKIGNQNKKLLEVIVMEIIKRGDLKEFDVAFCVTRYILQCNKRIVFCRHSPEIGPEDMREMEQEVIIYK